MVARQLRKLDVAWCGGIEPRHRFDFAADARLAARTRRKEMGDNRGVGLIRGLALVLYAVRAQHRL